MMNLLENNNSIIPKIITAVFIVAGIAVFIQGDVYFSNTKQEVRIEEEDAQYISVRVIKNEWRFEPEEIVVPANTVVRLRIFNEDSYQHGFGIRELGIDKVLPPQKETIIELSNISPGEYEFLCSVLCGKGHFEQKGKLIVR